MSGRLLLDTNAVIAQFAGDEALAQLTDAADVFLPCIVVGELIYGARESGRPEANLARIDDLTSSVPALPCDATTARIYGQIMDRLRAIGRPIPTNDVWVASLAMQHAPALVTRDTHFDHLTGLTLQTW